MKRVIAVKHLLLITMLTAAFSVSAVEIAVKPLSGWKTVDGKIFSIDFDGGRSWPTLLVSPKGLNPDCYYRISFDAKCEDGIPNTMLQVFSSHDSRTPVSSCSWKAGSAYSKIETYFRTGTTGEAIIKVYLNPEIAGKVSVRNITVKELSVSELGENLFIDGDFEAGN